MSIATYDDLIYRIKRWANREDLEKEDYEDFVHFAGNSVNQMLRVPAMEHTVILEVSEGGKVLLPYDYLELKSLTALWDSEDSCALERVAWDQFINFRNRDHLKDARYFAQQGPYIWIAPEPAVGQKVTMHYYRSMPDINSGEQTNWLLMLSPMSYLYGGLHYLHLYIQDEERAEYWLKKFQYEVDRIQNMADSASHKGSGLTIRDRDTSRIN